MKKLVEIKDKWYEVEFEMRKVEGETRYDVSIEDEELKEMVGHYMGFVVRDQNGGTIAFHKDEIKEPNMEIRRKIALAVWGQ